MLKEFLCAKIHRATVTQANLEYIGSITIDKTLLDEVGLKEFQRVNLQYERQFPQSQFGQGKIPLKQGLLPRLQKEKS